jgi:hypothetical protein
VEESQESQVGPVYAPESFHTGIGTEYAILTTMNNRNKIDNLKIRLSKILNLKIVASDGEIGKCKDVLFHEEKWKLAYLVADTSRWLPGKKVILNPSVIRKDVLFEGEAAIPVSITKQKVKDAPSIEEDAPVSMEYEKELSNYYQWPVYGGVAGSYLDPAFAPETIRPKNERIDEISVDSLLRSFNEVTSYKALAKDKEIGSLHDAIVDIGTWEFEYFIIKKGISNPQYIPVPVALVDTISFKHNSLVFKANSNVVEQAPRLNAEAEMANSIEERVKAYFKK